MESQSGFLQQISKSSKTAYRCIFIAIFLEPVITENILIIYKHIALSLLQPGRVKCNFALHLYILIFFCMKTVFKVSLQQNGHVLTQEPFTRCYLYNLGEEF
jgi:hypothetical protein